MAEARIAVLDDLRGVAILLVVLYHGVTAAFGFVPPTGGDYWLAYVYAGNTGVSLFFLLSGILVSRPFFLALHERRPVDLKHYALQRALRILPPYYLAVLVAVLVTGRYEQIPASMVFLAWGYDVGIFSNVWWSLATEMQFYLFLPLFFLALGFDRRLVAGALLIWLLLFVAVCLRWVSFGLLGNIYWALSLGGKLPVFLLGMGIGYLLAQQRMPTLKTSSGAAAVFLLVVGLAIFLQITVEHGVVEFSWRQPWIVLPEGLLWGAIAWVMLATPGLGDSLLGRPLRYLGRVSFSLYLIHQPVLLACLSLDSGAGMQVWLKLLMGMALSLALAHLSYCLIEKPTLSLKSRYSSRTKISEALPV